MLPIRLLRTIGANRISAAPKKRAEHTSQAAHDHHGDELDGQFDMKLVRGNRPQITDSEYRTRHAADERTDPESQQFEFEPIHADDFGRVILLAHCGERATQTRSPNVENEDRYDRTYDESDIVGRKIACDRDSEEAYRGDLDGRLGTTAYHRDV